MTAMTDFLASLVESANGSYKDLAHDLGIDPHWVGQLFREPLLRPTFPTLLYLAAAVQQPIEALLCSPLAAAAQYRFAFAMPQQTRLFRSKIGVYLRAQFEDALKKAANDRSSASPVSLASLCKSCGVTLGFAHYAFPSLVSRLTKKRLVWLASEKARKEREAMQVVQRELAKMSRAILPRMSQKRIIEKLMVKWRLPKAVLSRAVRAAVLDLTKQKALNRAQVGLLPTGR